MKRNLIVSLIAILFMSSICFGASYIIHDYDTGIMHMAQDIYLNNTRSVQTEIDSIEINLGTTYSISLKADKAGTLSQFTGGTNLNQIATRNHDDLQNISGNGTVHLSASEKSNYDTAYSHSQNTTSAHGLTISDVALKSGSLSQFTTRNASDINVTATAYGKGLSTAETTVQKVADRVNQNGTPQFVTDASKCSLLLDFKDGLSDKTRGIVPANYNSAVKWSDDFVNDNSSKEVATNISCTLKQFEGDEGLFGSGVAVEESRTNLLLQSDDLTSATWTKTNCTVTLDRIDNGRKIFKVTSTSGGAFWVYQPITTSLIPYSVSCFVQHNLSNAFSFDASGDRPTLTISGNSNFKKYTTNFTAVGTTTYCYFGFQGSTAGDTFYITSPQIEAGAFPTSYIATGAAAVTRPAGKLNFDLKLMDNKSDFTISTWIKPNFNYDTSDAPTLFKLVHPSGPTYFMYASATDCFQAGFGSGALIINSPTYTSNIGLQKDIHVVIKKSGINAYLYIDGNLVGTRNDVLTLAGITSFDFGYDSENSNRQINSNISNFAIFNYALSDAEIAQIYNSGLEGKPIVTTNPESIIGVGQTLHDPNFITFASGWGVSATYPNKPTLSKSSNVALMRGILEYSGVVNSDVTIFTLPVGARPSLPDTYYHSFVTTARDSGAPAMRILRVYGNGNVVLMANGATITNPAISLDNINYVNGK